MPGTIIGGFGDWTGDRCGEKCFGEPFSRFSMSLAGEIGADDSEKCIGDCCGLGLLPPTMESIENPIFGLDGTATIGVGASGIIVCLLLLPVFCYNRQSNHLT